MQSTTPSSQSHSQVTASNIDTVEDNHQPITAFARAITAAYRQTSQSNTTEEQPADDAQRLPNTDLLARTITETQALSVGSEPSSQSTIRIITAGRFNPLPVRKPMSDPSTDAFHLPEGHTYRPYFWISDLAHRLLARYTTEHESDLQSQVMDQLVMSERAARKKFQAHFEYRLVDYGYTSVDASGMPEKNYGVFASKPIPKGALLGIYSGIGYLLKSECWTKKVSSLRPDYLHQKFSDEMPDFMSYYRTVMADLRGKEQTQRTLLKFSVEMGFNNKLPNVVCIVPDLGHYTPMHFVNSADHPEDVNADFEYITVSTGSNNFLVPVLVATRQIPASQELLTSYRVDPEVKSRGVFERSATEEKEYFKGRLDDHLDLINKLNRAEPDRRPISPFVAAPAFCLSKVLRKTVRRKVAKRHQPSSIDASGN